MTDKYGKIEIVNKSDDKVDILFDGIVGDSFFEEGLTRKSLAREIKGAGNVKEIHLHINSPGGLVSEAMAIYAFLQQQNAKIVMHIAFAASAATFVAMAGDEIIMQENGEFMIHNSQVFAAGDKNVMAKVQEMLAQTDELINLTYVARTGLDRDEIASMMDETTLMTAAKAKDLGFVDSIVKAKARPARDKDDDTEKIEALYKRWAEAKDSKQFQEDYRIAASLVPVRGLDSQSFTVEPHRLGSTSIQQDGVVNVNSARYALACGIAEAKKYLDVWQQLDSENKRYLKTHKIELTDGKNVYPYTQLEVKMLNQLLQTLGVENVDDAIAKVDELKSAKAPVAENGEQLAQAKLSNELLKEIVADLRSSKQEQKDAAMNAEIEELVKTGYIKASQKDGFVAQYKENKQTFDFLVATLKEDEPRWAGLLGDPEGTTATVEREKSTDPVVRFENAIKKVQDEEKLDYAKAFEFMRNSGEYDEIISAYESAMV